MRRAPALALMFCLLSVAAVQGQEPRGMVYDFSAVWCSPCQQMAPLVEKLQREGLPVQKIDVDQQRDFAGRFNIQQMPTFVLVIDGKEVERTTGRMTESDLRRMVAKIPASASQQNPAGPRQSTASTARGSGLIPIELGQPAPLVRPAPISTAREEVRVAETEPKRGLRNLLPFGREKPAEAPPVVRGNDSAVSFSESLTSSSESAAAADPMESSVRIRVITNGRIDLGSGTVISSQQGLSHILTCAHIFKGFTEDSRIEVDLFENGRPVQFLATLEKFDEKSDVGLIKIPTTTVVRATPVATAAQNPKVGDTVAAIGCSGGDEPTRQQSRITDIDKYEGPHNLLCTGVPVRGRSGGGLFNQHGEVIGVCSAADEPAQRGFYSGLLAVHQLLNDCGLANLYQPTKPTTPALAASQNPPAAVPNNSAFEMNSASPFGTSPTAPGSPAPFNLNAASMTAPATAPMDVQAGNAEVVVIIRDPQQPQAPNRVVILHQASPKFLSYLSGELTEGAIDTNLLGSNLSPEIPAITRAVRQDSPAITTARPMPQETKDSLLPTTMSRPVIPQRFTRSR